MMLIDVEHARPGDVVFFHTATDTLGRKLKNFVSWQIQHWGQSPWNHVALVSIIECVMNAKGTQWEPNWTPWIVEAVGSGVREVPLPEAMGKNEIMIKRPCYPPGGILLALQAARNQVGVPYGFVDLAQILAWRLTGIYKPWKTKAMICSELVGYALAEGGVVIVPENGVVWTPRDLDMALEGV